jgi:hypothetical protein
MALDYLIRVDSNVLVCVRVDLNANLSVKERDLDRLLCILPYAVAFLNTNRYILKFIY